MKLHLSLMLICMGIAASPPLSAQEPKVRETLKGQTLPVPSVAFRPDGKTMASGSYDYTIKLWDVATGKERATLKGHRDLVESVAFSPEGKNLASGDTDGAIKLWDIPTVKKDTK